MLNSLKHSLKLINKDQFETALLKSITELNPNPPKPKHLALIMQSLQGLNPKISSSLALSKLQYQIIKLTPPNYLKSLKTLYILHLLITQHPNIQNKNLLQALKPLQQIQPIQTQDIKLYLHLNITHFYITHLLLLPDASNSTKVQLIKLLSRYLRQFDISLHKYQIPILQNIYHLILIDIIQTYQLLLQITNAAISQFNHTQLIDQTSYKLYQDLIQITKIIKKAIHLRVYVQHLLTPNQIILIDSVDYYQVDHELNKALELHMQSTSSYASTPISYPIRAPSQICYRKSSVPEEPSNYQSLPINIQQQQSFFLNDPILIKPSQEEQDEAQPQKALTQKSYAITNSIDITNFMDGEKLQRKSDVGGVRVVRLSHSRINACKTGGVNLSQERIIGMNSNNQHQGARPQSVMNKNNNFFDVKESPLSFLEMKRK